MADYESYKDKLTTAEDVEKLIVAAHQYEAAKLKPTLADVTRSANRAQGLLNTTKESEDGTDVKPTDYWTDSAARQALQEAIEAAQGVVSGGTEDPGEIESAKQAIDQAIETFEAARKLGTYQAPSNLAELKRKLAEANQDLNSVQESEDGSDIESDKQWVTSEDKQTFSAAIDKAQGVADQDTPSESDITQAMSELESAKQTFDEAKQAGTKAPADAKSKLTAKKSEAETLLASATKSADGTDVEQGKQWVDNDTYEALERAIEQAGTALQGDDADTIQQAQTQLESAMDAFTQAKKDGTKAPASAKEKLQGDKDTAQGLLDSVTKSTDGSDVTSDKEWVDDATYEALQQAIQQAESAIEADDADQIQQAQSQLDSAKQAFEEAKKPGLKATDQSVSELTSAIEEAQSTLSGASRSEDGSDVTSDNKWVDGDTYDALQQAIQEATEASQADPTVQADVDAAKEGLESAKQAFEAAKQDGLKATEEAKGALTSKKSEAETLLASASSSENGKDVADTEKWVDTETYNQLEQAIQAVDGAVETGTDEAVKQAQQTLESAMQAFEAAKKDGIKPNLEELGTKLSNAQTALGTATASEDGSDVPENKFWVPQATYNALNEAIQTATSLQSQGEDADHDEVDNAISELESALEAFNSAKQSGTDTKEFEPGTELSAIPWENLDSWASDMVDHPEKYNELVGQEKEIHLDGYGNFNVRLIGIKQDVDESNNYIACTWEFKDIITTHSMNDTSSNIGGYPAMPIREFLNTTLYSAMQSAIRDQIVSASKKSFTKVTISDNPETTASTGETKVTTMEKLWLLSCSEAGKLTNLKSDGDNTYPFYTGEGETYKFYADNDTRANHQKQYLESVNGYPHWLRSIDGDDKSHISTSFYVIGASGDIHGSSTQADRKNGIAPCFCTGRTTKKAELDAGGKLENLTWAMISAAATDAASNPEKYKHLLGEEKSIMMGGDIGAQALILIGIGQDDLGNGQGKAGFTFQFKDILLKHNMNTNVLNDFNQDSTSGGWELSVMRTSVMQDVFNKLPAIVQPMVKEVSKKTYNKVVYNGSYITPSELTATTDKLWLLSGTEYGPKTHYGSSTYDSTTMENEGVWYKYFELYDSKDIFIKKYDGSADHWVLRSISGYSDAYTKTHFKMVAPQGHIRDDGWASPPGVCPCFCI